jgi:hypothetical protein
VSKDFLDVVDRASVKQKLGGRGVSEDVRGNWLYETRKFPTPGEGTPDVGSLEPAPGVSCHEHGRVIVRAHGEIRINPVESG